MGGCHIETQVLFNSWLEGTVAHKEMIFELDCLSCKEVAKPASKNYLSQLCKLCVLCVLVLGSHF